MRINIGVLISGIVLAVVTFVALTQQQANSLITVVQSSPGTPASAFVSLITAFSNITTTQASSLITVVQAAPGVPANAFVNLLTSFTVDTPVAQPATQTQTTQTTSVSELKISNVKTVPTIDQTSFEWDTDLSSEGKVYVTRQGESLPQIVASFSGVATHHTASLTTQPDTTYSYTIESIMGEKFAKLNGTISTPALPKPTCTLTATTTTSSTGSLVGKIEWTTNLDPANGNHSAVLTGNSVAPGRALTPITGGSISGFRLSTNGPTVFEMAAHNALYSLTTFCSATINL